MGFCYGEEIGLNSKYNHEKWKLIAREQVWGQQMDTYQESRGILVNLPNRVLSEAGQGEQTSPEDGRS